MFSSFLNTPLLSALDNYENLGRRRFTVPGHAGLPLTNAGFPGLPSSLYRYDQTEVEGLDVLGNPSECLKAAQAATAIAVRANHTFFLMNGSTGGLLAGMLAMLKPGDKVLLPRNAHRSLISGLILTGAIPVWFLPDRCPDWGLWQGIRVEQINTLLCQYKDIKALVVTSPTYEGLGTNMDPIGALCKTKGVYLLVDEAHGSLWPYSERLPRSAIQCDCCDLVVQSSHKNSGSLTQSALAHLPHGSRLRPEHYQQALNLVQTTSPSYILMASLDACRSFWCSIEGQSHLNQHLDQVDNFRQQLQNGLDLFELFEDHDNPFWDPTRIVLRSRGGEAGTLWAPRVELDWNIPYEDCCENFGVYVAGVGLEAEDYTAFLQAFQNESLRIKEGLASKINFRPFAPLKSPFSDLPQQAMPPREAYFSAGHRVFAANSVGEIAKETVVHCPPGIPLLLPGEVIQAEYLPYLPETIEVVQHVY